MEWKAACSLVGSGAAVEDATSIKLSGLASLGPPGDRSATEGESAAASRVGEVSLGSGETGKEAKGWDELKTFVVRTYKLMRSSISDDGRE